MLLSLLFGVTDVGEFVHIDEAPRGASNLHCPYCGGPLLAKKGDVRVHHFAHSGETCLQAERDDAPVAYDHFDLYLPPRVLQTLHEFPHTNGFDLLEQYGLVTLDHGEWTLTDRGRIPRGELSLVAFSMFQERLLAERYSQLEAAAVARANYPDALAKLIDLQLFQAHWRRNLTSSLYLLEVPPLGIHKIGVTRRSLNSRVEEIEVELSQYVGDKPKIHRVLQLQGRAGVELYFKHKYCGANYPIGNLSEFFRFRDIKSVMRDLSDLGRRQLTPLEVRIFQGEPSPLEEYIRWEYARALAACVWY